MQIGQKKTMGQKMKKERNRGRETDRKPNISQIQKTGEHCIYAKRCGGCDYQGILYSQQLSKKQSYMRKLMEPFGKINPIIGMDDPYHYRHKVQAAFSCNKRGHIVAVDALQDLLVVVDELVHADRTVQIIAAHHDVDVQGLHLGDGLGDGVAVGVVGEVDAGLTQHLGDFQPILAGVLV